MLKNYTFKGFAIAIIAFFSLQGISQDAFNFSDDFESYDVGSYLAKSSDTWTTWSNKPGTSEDAKISDVQAKSGTKSVYLKSIQANGGPTDLVFPAPQVYETGTITFETKVFVDKDKGGYFNFQGASKLGDAYTFDVYMVNNGKFYVTQSANSILSINSSYPTNTWFDLKIIGDMTINLWTVEIEGEVVGSFASAINKFSAIDFYPVNSKSVGGNELSSYYIDDFSFDYAPFVPLQKDGALLEASLGNQFGLVNMKSSISGKLINVGVDTINSFEAKWTYGAQSGTKTFGGLALKTLDRYAFEFDDSISLIAGQNNLEIEIISLNSNTDDNIDNNKKEIGTFAVVPAAEKKYVGEELTGTWCGWCPRGAVALDYMTNKYPNYFIGIAVHGGNGDSDPMKESKTYFPGSAAMASKLTNDDWGFPGMLSMRNKEIDPGNVESSFLEEIQKPTTGKMLIGSDFDDDSRKLKVSVSTSFLNQNDNQYSVSVILIENGVKGTGSKWNQANYYSGREPALIGAGHNWKNEPNPVPASKMTYNEVGRACLGKYEGEPLKNSHNTTDVEVLNFNYTVPDGFKTENMEIVALLLKADGSVENAEEVDFQEALENGFVKVIENINWHDVVINEFLASNDSLSGIADQDGEFDDWIELYNNTNHDIDLSNVYLSDKFSKPQAWQFPADTFIKANSYLIVWADKDTDQEGLHAKIKLSSKGENLLLTNGDGSFIDSLTFGEQTTNVAYARVPNGTGDFIFKAPTFNGTNVPEATIELNDDNIVKVYPVPTDNYLTVEFEENDEYQVKVLNAMGQVFLSENMSDKRNRLDISRLRTGQYILQIYSNGRLKGNTRFVIVK